MPPARQARQQLSTMPGRYVPKKGERVAVLLCGANTKAVDFS